MIGKIIEIHDLYGNKKTYDILMTFDSENTKKSYVVYTNYEQNINGKFIVYASIYDRIDGNLVLEDVNTKEESDFINNFLKEQQTELNFEIKGKIE